MIHKQLVTDENGQPTSVLIPYMEWLEIERRLSELVQVSSAKNLQRHAGVLHLTEDPLEYQRRLRNEWK
jgi:hypothetical protein